MVLENVDRGLLTVSSTLTLLTAVTIDVGSSGGYDAEMQELAGLTIVAYKYWLHLTLLYSINLGQSGPP